MSHEILMQELRRKSDERVKEIWQKVKSEAASIRSARQQDLEQRQAEMHGRLKEVEEKVAAPILHKARCNALAIEDEALAKLSERLYLIAVGLLKKLRQDGYDELFADLVKEVPSITWEKVTVNQKDVELAQKHFSGAEIKTDPAISGGFVASTDKGAYLVTNTLDRRLEKGWSKILPSLLQDLMKDLHAEPVA